MTKGHPAICTQEKAHIDQVLGTRTVPLVALYADNRKARPVRRRTCYQPIYTITAISGRTNLASLTPLSHSY
jgi:hypothetical protein